MTGLACLLGAAPAAQADHAKSWYFHSGAGLNFATEVNDEELDLGYRLGVGVGYHLTHNLALEFDTGWLYNSFSDFDGSLTHVPFMANAVYTYPIKDGKWEVYGGGGIGGSYSILTVEEIGLDDSDGDITFAWQLMAGVRYNFQDNMSLGAGYKYLGSTGGDYDIDGVGLDLDESHNHSFSVTFNWRF